MRRPSAALWGLLFLSVAREIVGELQIAAGGWTRANRPAPWSRRPFARRALEPPVFGLRAGATPTKSKKADDKAKAGAKKDAAPESKEESRSIVNYVLKSFKTLRPATRAYMSIVIILTVAVTFGLVDEQLLALNPAATLLNLQLWRPLTAAFFLGKISLPFAVGVYFVVMYGQGLERDRGTADYVVFLLSEIFLLTLLGPMLGMPFTSSSLVSSALWVSCRRQPTKRMPLGFMGITLEAWLLPFGRMGIDCLQAQSGSAAIPHLLGFFTGHFYHFVTKVWPLVGGTDFLRAPPKMKQLLDKKPARKDKKKGSAIKKKKKRKVPTGTGYKLGGDADGDGEM